jgi:redox-sensitive bicupin YhaK (pirin superfamily)
MSGPVTTADVPAEQVTDHAETCEVELTESRRAQVGSFVVRRALPRRERRMVGAWCFVDHMGPGSVPEQHGLDVGPHPHIGLQTVTWLLLGELLHRDSLGSEQVIRPGQLNLMTAGHGVAHSEEATGSYRGELHGVQLWVAQPSTTRHGPAAFEHRAQLPSFELANGVGTVVVGEFEGKASPARRDTDHAGIDLDLRPGVVDLPLDARYEWALVVFEGALAVGDCTVTPGHLAYLGTGRQDVRLEAREPARALLVGGVPFPEPILMWWNYVGRERAEITEAHRQWTEGSERFGRVASPLPRIDTGPPPWPATRPAAQPDAHRPDEEA